MKILHCLCAAILVLTLSGPAAAQTVTGRSVRIVVPFPPGGTADILARMLGQQIAQSGGPTIVVENRPGGGTVIATEHVARAAPDGTTVLLMANSFVINASVRASLPARTPKEIIAQHTAMFKSALATPEVQGKLPAQGYRSIGVCGEAFGAHIKQQFQSYARVIKDANIKAD